MKIYRRYAYIAFAFLAALSLTCNSRVFAAATTADQAKSAVTGWLKSNPQPLGAVIGQEVGKVDTFRDESGAPLYYVVNIKPTGFVIVSADDRIEPIIAFASKGTYDGSDKNPLGALVNRDLRVRSMITHAQTKNRSLGDSIPTSSQKKWTALLNANESSVQSRNLGLITDVRVFPLVQSLWSQSDVSGAPCYNYYTPSGPGNTNNYVCGCVATAMAQLMRYYQYPVGPNNTGPLSYQINNGPQQTANVLGGNGSGGPYNWTLMELDPFDNGVNTAQCQAIGSLCYDAGISVDMNYNELSSTGDVLGSGAHSANIASALKQTFGYSNAIFGIGSGTSPLYAITSGTVPLFQMINPNLDAGLPVLLAISEGTEGHEVVCDGYGYSMTTLYHHLNLGWASNTTGAIDGTVPWYALPNIDVQAFDPNDPYAFNSIDTCVYNVFNRGSGEIISSLISDAQGNGISGAAVTAKLSNGTVFSTTTNARGIFAFAGIPPNSTYTINVNASGVIFPAQTVTTGMSTDNNSTSGNQWFPTISCPTSAIGVVGSPFSFPITATNSRYSESISGLPIGLSIDQTTGAISGTPLLSTNGPTSITISASTLGGTSNATIPFEIFPVLGFSSPPTYSPSPAVVGKPVTFTSFPNISSAAMTWGFGDGLTGTGDPMVHTYSAPGLYTITLSANHALTNQTFNSGTYSLLVESAINFVQSPKRKFNVAFPSKIKDSLGISIICVSSNGNAVPVPVNFGYSAISAKDFSLKTDGLKLQIFLGNEITPFDTVQIFKGKAKTSPNGGSGTFQWSYRNQTIRYQLKNQNLVSLLQLFGVTATATQNLKVMIPFFVDINGVRYGGTYSYFYTESRGRGKGTAAF